MPRMVASSPIAPRMGLRAPTVMSAPTQRRAACTSPKKAISSRVHEAAQACPGCHRGRACRSTTCPSCDVLLELLAELAEEAERRHRRALAERADGVAHDVVGDLAEAIELLDRGLALHDARRGCGRARRCPRGRACTGRTTRGGRSASGSGKASTGSALSERTIAQQVPSMVPSARKVSTPIGTSSTLLPCQGWSGDLLVRRVDELVGAQDGARRAARDHGEQLAVAHAAAELVDELAQRERRRTPRRCRASSRGR